MAITVDPNRTSVVFTSDNEVEVKKRFQEIACDGEDEVLVYTPFEQALSFNAEITDSFTCVSSHNIQEIPATTTVDLFQSMGFSTEGISLPQENLFRAINWVNNPGLVLPGIEVTCATDETLLVREDQRLINGSTIDPARITGGIINLFENDIVTNVYDVVCASVAETTELPYDLRTTKTPEQFASAQTAKYESSPQFQEAQIEMPFHAGFAAAYGMGLFVYEYEACFWDEMRSCGLDLVVQDPLTSFTYVVSDVARDNPSVPDILLGAIEQDRSVH